MTFMKKLILTLLFATSLATSVQATNTDTLYVNPNPCDSVTTIHFSISQTDTISLDVYDVVGQLKKNFFTNTILPGGLYSINFITYPLPYGVYFVRLKINSTLKVAKIIKTQGVGINENSSSLTKINVFPNPTADKLNISYNGLKTIQLIDLSGKTVYQTQTDLNIINLSNIATGGYILQVYTDKKELIVNQKIIKTQ